MHGHMRLGNKACQQPSAHSTHPLNGNVCSRDTQSGQGPSKPEQDPQSKMGTAKEPWSCVVDIELERQPAPSIV